jgi:hypothetical protein
VNEADRWSVSLTLIDAGVAPVGHGARSGGPSATSA